MNTETLPPSETDAEHAEERCQIVVLYEDVSTRQRAQRACTRLVDQFAPEMCFHFTWCKFDRLGSAPRATAAARAATRADLIIFAAHDEGEWPEHLKRWIESWQYRRQQGDGALAALLLHENESKPPTTARSEYLHQVAQHARLDYLLPESPLIAESRVPAATPVTPEISGTRGVIHFENLEQPLDSRRWGLNE